MKLDTKLFYDETSKANTNHGHQSNDSKTLAINIFMEDTMHDSISRVYVHNQNKINSIDFEHGETFYGRYTAQAIEK